MTGSLVNMQLGRYKVVSKIGQGAMGVVYRATDPLLERDVAIKTIRIDVSANEREEFKKRFFREAKSAAKLNHRNIVTVFDAGEVEDVAYIAMELLDGQDLRNFLGEGERLSLERAASIIADVANALHYAHEQGVIHRDVKPGNIILLSNNTVKLADFGIARLQSSNATQTGQMFGTPKYMAPEQIMGKPADARADIFSLGVVLYQLVTGVAPFDGETFSAIMFSVIQEPAMSPSDIVGKVPAGVEYILSKALAKKPENRYQSAMEMEADLRYFALSNEKAALPWGVGGLRSKADSGRVDVPQPLTSAAAADMQNTVVMQASDLKHLSTARMMAAPAPVPTPPVTPPADLVSEWEKTTVFRANQPPPEPLVPAMPAGTVEATASPQPVTAAAPVPAPLPPAPNIAFEAPELQDTPVHEHDVTAVLKAGAMAEPSADHLKTVVLAPSAKLADAVSKGAQQATVRKFAPLDDLPPPPPPPAPKPVPVAKAPEPPPAPPPGAIPAVVLGRLEDAFPDDGDEEDDGVTKPQAKSAPKPAQKPDTQPAAPVASAGSSPSPAPLAAASTTTPAAVTTAKEPATAVAPSKAASAGMPKWLPIAAGGLVVVGLIGWLVLGRSTDKDVVVPEMASDTARPTAPAGAAPVPAPAPADPSPAPVATTAPPAPATPPAAQPKDATAAADTRPAKVTFAITPWGQVFVNGDDKGTAPPLTELELPPGDHTIVIKNGDLKPFEQKITIKPNERRRIVAAF
jgi:serine/threonine-protein kinase